MSPEFRLRPSLSGEAVRRDRGGPCHVSPEFRLRPSLSGERPCTMRRGVGGVAGVQTPAFVERIRHCKALLYAARVSPEFRLRPSLSVAPSPGGRGALRPVSPEFRLRPSLSAARPFVRRGGHVVSPEFRLRPSLSVCDEVLELGDRQVSPEFRLRPSLSDGDGGDGRGAVVRVAGVQTPAFVERGRRLCRAAARSSVAGVQTPAFVERA